MAASTASACEPTLRSVQRKPAPTDCCTRTPSPKRTGNCISNIAAPGRTSWTCDLTRRRSKRIPPSAGEQFVRGFGNESALEACAIELVGTRLTLALAAGNGAGAIRTAAVHLVDGH